MERLMDLKMTPSFLQNHYELTIVEHGYEFHTDKGIVYFVGFVSYPVVYDFLSIKTYMFNIDRLSELDVREGQDDIKVRNTILYVIYSFFQEHQDALITICDVMDGKQNARRRLFDRWFDEFNNGTLIKLDAECDLEETKTFASLIFSSNNECAEELKQNFEELKNLNFFN